MTVDLDRTDLRGNQFSELIYSFKLAIPRRSEVISCISLHDGGFASLSSVPTVLSIIDPTHTTSFSVDLFEYFPPQQQLKLELVEVGAGRIFICNEKEAKIVIVDLIESKTSLIHVCFLNNRV
jgi:hypothetical protein